MMKSPIEAPPLSIRTPEAVFCRLKFRCSRWLHFLLVRYGELFRLSVRAAVDS